MFLIFLVLLSILIFFKLFREFGKTQKIIVNLSEADKEKLQKTLEQIIPINIQKQPIQNQENNKDIEKLQEIFPDFSVDSFQVKTEEIFDAVFNGFANSHHHVLKALLSENLYEDFAIRIQKREEKDLRQELLIKHKQTKLEKIQLLSEKVRIFVTFEISQMSA
ncbi:MAG: TIM44-like domain-containing protein, partial [Alphaproteobacteria bacterium]|nr:TIM44-like domain-containing protein [Alphaproteobacteria bacterium]